MRLPKMVIIQWGKSQQRIKKTTDKMRKCKHENTTLTCDPITGSMYQFCNNCKVCFA